MVRLLSLYFLTGAACHKSSSFLYHIPDTSTARFVDVFQNSYLLERISMKSNYIK